MYVLVRADLKSRHQAVQAIHAGISAARELIPLDETHPNLVVLTVENQQDLVAASCRLSDAGIEHRVFREADMDDEATALATEPLAGDLREVFAEYRLLR